MENESKLIALALVAFVLIYFAYRLLRHGVRKGLFFSSPVLKTVGEVRTSNGVKFRVHVLDTENPKVAIGFDLILTGGRSYLQLSTEESEELALLLKTASAEKRLNAR
ncbi:MAG: hypothetical protein WD034_00445 [Parvibaculum sp.]